LQTFQKLIFISNLVFGDQKAAFLLPWRRTFNLTDSQLAIAKRDSAKALFKSFLDERGGFQASRSPQFQLEQPAVVRTGTHRRSKSDRTAAMLICCESFCQWHAAGRQEAAGGPSLKE
jgi:Chloroplast envelope transporter